MELTGNRAKGLFHYSGEVWQQRFVSIDLYQASSAVDFLQWGSKGIRVNNLCPGYMKTDLIIDLLAKEGRHIEDGWVKDVPMGRLAHPSELQGTIVWMASDASSYLNGSDIVSVFP
jgi:NAD(P)-dependent dehydrogenase (short-subunit alcohol dehydrogenase family)